MTERLAYMAEGREDDYKAMSYAATLDMHDPKQRLRWSGTISLFPERLDQPLRWRKPRRIFVCSLSDLFHDWVPDQFVDKVLAVAALCPQHTFQILTKRPDRMKKYMTDSNTPDQVGTAIMEVTDRWKHRPPIRLVNASFTDDTGYEIEAEALTVDWPLPNVELGTSIEDQKRANKRVPDLLQTPAAVRFVSAEPLLGPILLDREKDPWLSCVQGLDWVIVGGESGPGARPCDVDWIRSIVRDCKQAGVPAFVKQLGKRPRIGKGFTTASGEHLYTANDYLHLQHAKGGDPNEWPSDLRVREWPKEKG